MKTSDKTVGDVLIEARASAPKIAKIVAPVLLVVWICYDNWLRYVLVPDTRDIIAGLFTVFLVFVILFVLLLGIRLISPAFCCDKCGRAWVKLNKTGRKDEEGGSEYECKCCGLLWEHLTGPEANGDRIATGTSGAENHVKAYSWGQILLMASLGVGVAVLVHVVIVRPLVDLVVAGEFDGDGRLITSQGSPIRFWSSVSFQAVYALVGVVVSWIFMMRSWKALKRKLNSASQSR